MAIVKMLTRVSGTRNGVDWPERGDTLEVSADEAATLVAIGVAVATDADGDADADGVEPEAGDADADGEAAVVDLDEAENASTKPPRGRKAQ